MSFGKMTLAACLVVGGFASAAISQVVSYHVAWSNFEVEPWTLVPVYAEQDGVPSDIVGFLALADPSALIGNNLAAVWYERVGLDWQAQSWASSDPWVGIEAIKEMYSISDAEDGRWGVPSGAPISPQQPVGYVSGVLATDPLAPVIQASPEPEVIVGLLAGIGYQAASLPVDNTDDCSADSKLDGMAAAIMETLVGDESTMVDRSMGAWGASGVANCAFATLAVEIVTLPPRPAPPGTWGPPSYVCEETLSGGEFAMWSTCLYWHQTRVVTQKRTRVRWNPNPPPQIQFCDQTRSGMETKTYKCCDGDMLLLRPPVPCPPVNPPGSVPPIGTGCVGTLTSTEKNYSSWSGWAPPCPF